MEYYVHTVQHLKMGFDIKWGIFLKRINYMINFRLSLEWNNIFGSVFSLWVFYTAPCPMGQPGRRWQEGRHISISYPVSGWAHKSSRLSCCSTSCIPTDDLHLFRKLHTPPRLDPTQKSGLVIVFKTRTKAITCWSHLRSQSSYSYIYLIDKLVNEYKSAF